jgi:hypothetical protein
MPLENDLVLIYFEDQPFMFARIESILPDHKPDWYHVKLLLLQIPLQVVTWILRDAYINGEGFTMNGKRMRLEAVKVPESPDGAAEDAETQASKKSPRPSGATKVISLANIKKKE